MLARVLLIISIVFFVALTGPCVAVPIEDPNPSMSAAEKRADSNVKRDIVLGWLSSGFGIAVSLAFVRRERM